MLIKDYKRQLETTWSDHLDGKKKEIPNVGYDFVETLAEKEELDSFKEDSHDALLESDFCKSNRAALW